MPPLSLRDGSHPGPGRVLDPQAAGHLCGRWSLTGIRVGHLRNEDGERRIDVARDVRVAFQARQRRRQRLTRELPVSGQAFEQHQAEAVHIARWSGFLATNPFRRQVGRCPHHLRVAGRWHLLQGLGHTEIGQEGLTAITQQDVVRLDVAVDDTVAVQVIQGQRDVRPHRLDPRLGHRLRLLAQGATDDELHYAPRLLVLAMRVDTSVEEPHQLRMIQRSGQLHLEFEPPTALLGAGAGAEDLDRYLTTEDVVRGDEDVGHPPTSEQLLDPVAPAEDRLR